MADRAAGLWFTSPRSTWANPCGVRGLGLKDTQASKPPKEQGEGQAKQPDLLHGYLVTVKDDRMLARS